MSDDAMSDDAMSGDAMSGDAMSGDAIGLQLNVTALTRDAIDLVEDGKSNTDFE
jgi:pentapeptide MXKDX repeat protein